MDEPISTKDLLRRIDSNYEELRKDFHEWKQGNHEDKKGIYKRLTSLEEKALYIPNPEESDLIKEAAAFYRTKRQFREKLYSALLEKGVTGLVIFVVTAVFFYLKHLFTGE